VLEATVVRRRVMVATTKTATIGSGPQSI
jgi:hypothetical protein